MNIPKDVVITAIRKKIAEDVTESEQAAAQAEAENEATRQDWLADDAVKTIKYFVAGAAYLRRCVKVGVMPEDLAVRQLKLEAGFRTNDTPIVGRPYLKRVPQRRTFEGHRLNRLLMLLEAIEDTSVTPTFLEKAGFSVGALV